MENNWEIKILGDLCEYSTDRFKNELLNDKNYISTENMLPNKCGVIKANSIPNAKTVTQYDYGSILISNIRPYFKKIWYANKEGGASNDVLVLKNKHNQLVESKYLYYCLLNDNFFDYMMASSKGTKMPRGDKNAILKYEIKIPSLRLQKKIASILSTLDDKIELNNEMNKTLEEMAQAIFKSWFVDFEPFKDGEFEESELGMIPKGYKVGCVSDLCDVSSSKRIFMSDYRDEGVPFYRGKEIIEKAKGNDISTEIYIEENKFNEIKDKFGAPQQGDILLTSVGTIGVPYLVKNEEFYFKDGNLTWFKDFNLKGYNYYLYYWIKFGEGKRNIDKITIGSTQKALTISSLKGMKIIIPNDNDIKRFVTYIESIVQRYEKNITESNLLKKIRDTLLPKLISGQIKI